MDTGAEISVVNDENMLENVCKGNKMALRTINGESGGWVTRMMTCNFQLPIGEGVKVKAAVLPEAHESMLAENQLGEHGIRSDKLLHVVFNRIRLK